MLFSYLLLAQHAQLKKVTPDMATAVTVLQKVIARGWRGGKCQRCMWNWPRAMVMGVVLEVAVFRAYGRITQDLSQLSETLVAACWGVLAGYGSPLPAA